MPDRKPSENLLLGRRALEHLPYCQIVVDWEWFPAKEMWGLRLRLRVEPQGLIPEWTTWYILSDPAYPLGEIETYPAKDGGIEVTFPHQSLNSFGDPEMPWRRGKTCEQTSLRTFGRRKYDIEPLTASDRLSWRVSRLWEWLIAAREDRLSQSGDPFELPDFPHGQSNIQIAFIEDQASFNIWQSNNEPCGLVDLANPLVNNSIFAAVRFKKKNGDLLWTVQYGDVVSTKAAIIGLWIRTREVPHVSPWQAPTTFAELVDALSRLGANLQQMLEELGKYMRDGRRHPLLIGFPIPSRIGDPAKRYHWQGLLLPEFSYGDIKGFRATEKAYIARDKSIVFRPNLKLEWLNSENWEPSQIGTRGILGDEIRSKKILIIGAGTLGSMMSEILVREGCRDFVIIDYQMLQIGNLTRHTLGLGAVATRKADALGARLTTLNPHARVSVVPRAFPPRNDEDHATIASCDIIIDCTGDDTVLNSMSNFEWKSEKRFFSISVGLYARRVFLFYAASKTFPHQLFTEKIQPWIEKELVEYRDVELPKGGIGCWHPVFPARADDLWLACSIAGKRIAEVAGSSSLQPSLEVFEQQYREGSIEGVRKVV